MPDVRGAGTHFNRSADGAAPAPRCPGKGTGRRGPARSPLFAIARGVRLGVLKPGLYAMQVRALVDAAHARGIRVLGLASWSPQPSAMLEQ